MPKQATKKIVISSLLILVLISIYGRIRNHNYIYYSDHLLMVNNPTMTRPLTFSNVYRALLDHPDYIPFKTSLTIIVHMAKWHFFGDDFGLHHLVSLFFHIVTVILIFYLMAHLTDDIGKSAFSAAIIAVHPLHVEAVCWLTNINSLMADFFLVVALAVYLYYRKKPGIKRYLLILIPFTLGLLSKPTVVVLPLLMLVFDFWPPSNWKQKTAAPSGHSLLILEKIPFLFIVLAPYAVSLMTRFLGRPDKINALTQVTQAFHPEGLKYAFWPLMKAVVPVNLTICRAYPPPGSLWAAGGIVLLMIMITTFVLSRARRYPYIAFGWCWYVFSMLPILFMLVFSGRPIADRHTYLPMIGIFVSLPYVFSGVCETVPHRRIFAYTLAGVVLTALSFLSISQVKNWKDSTSVFEQAIKVNPDNARAHINLGDVLLRQGRPDAAIGHYNRAIAQMPESAAIHTKIAYAYSRQGKNGKAGLHYEKGLELNPGYAIGHHNYADFLARQKQPDKAIRHYLLALQIAPYAYQTHNNLATVYAAQGEYEQARYHFSQALAINPDYETAKRNIKNMLPPSMRP